MIKKTSDSPQLDLLATPVTHLSKRSQHLFEDKKAWHNIFRNEVTFAIDENIFTPLFSTTGRPSAPLRVLVAMLILKESEGISDEKLYENCRYNLLFRNALGLINLNDDIPTESTYYLFRKRIFDYENTHDINLLSIAFEQITKKYSQKYDVSGKYIRMDSKIIGSNIAWPSRFEIVNELFRSYIQNSKIKNKLTSDLKKQINVALVEDSKLFSYQKNKDEIWEKMNHIGDVIYKVLKKDKYTSNEKYILMKRIFDEQYEIVDNQVKARENRKISPDSIQSPHDTECSYRSKGNYSDKNNKVKGYSINVTETCNKDQLNLITSVSLEKATMADSDFFTQDVEKTKNVLDSKIEHVNCDGAYNSQANQMYCINNNINWILSGIQGSKGRFEFELKENNELIVFDVNTKIKRNAVILEKNNDIKWRIEVDGKYRYFTGDNVRTFFNRKAIEETPKEEIHRRNNVEATIFQMSLHCRKNKTKYRGISQNRTWAVLRAMWINFRRVYMYCLKLMKSNCIGSENLSFVPAFTSVYFMCFTYGLGSVLGLPFKSPVSFKPAV